MELVKTWRTMATDMHQQRQSGVLGCDKGTGENPILFGEVGGGLDLLDCHVSPPASPDAIQTISPRWLVKEGREAHDALINGAPRPSLKEHEVN